jgi:hypothetical protein
MINVGKTANIAKMCLNGPGKYHFLLGNMESS